MNENPVNTAPIVPRPASTTSTSRDSTASLRSLSRAAGGTRRAAHHGGRSPSGTRGRRPRAALPADRGPRDRPGRGLRDAVPLAALVAGAARAGPVPAPGRGDRADGADRGVGAGGGV